MRRKSSWSAGPALAVPVLVGALMSCVTVPATGQEKDETLSFSTRKGSSPVQNVLRDLSKKHEAVHSYHATFRSMVNRPNMQVESSGERWFLRNGDEVYLRVNESRTTRREGAEPVESWAVTARQGEMVWQAGGVDEDVRADHSPSFPYAPDVDTILHLSEEVDVEVKLLPEEYLGDRECVLVEVRKPHPLRPDDPPMVATVYFDRETGILLRQDRTASDGGTSTMEFTLVSVNGEIDKSVFDYTPPEGAKITRTLPAVEATPRPGRQ